MECLRALLADGDTPERAWAAWTIGLRLGPDATETLKSALTVERNPGARRHILTHLAGYGEFAALLAIADGDPDTHVRATAMAYVVRICSPTCAEVNLLLRNRLTPGTPPAELIALLNELKSEHITDYSDCVLTLLESNDRDVRAAAADRLVDWTTESSPWMSRISNLVSESRDIGVRSRFIQLWWSHGVPADIITFASASKEPLRSDLLHYPAVRKTRFRASVLNPLLTIERHYHNTIIDLLLVEHTQDCREFLLTMLCSNPLLDSWPPATESEPPRAVDQLVSMLRDCHDPRTELESNLLHRLEDHIANADAPAPPDDDEYHESEYYYWRDTTGPGPRTLVRLRTIAWLLRCRPIGRAG